MWSAMCLLFLRQTGSRLLILEVCKIPIFSFVIVVDIFSHGSSQKPELMYNWSALTSYSVATEIGYRIRILQRCKFRSGLERLRTQFCTIFHKNLRSARKCDRLDACCFWDKPEVDIILEVCEFWFWQFPSCACHVFLWIVTKIQTDLKLICIDFISSINKTRNRNWF